MRRSLAVLCFCALVCPARAEDSTVLDQAQTWLTPLSYDPPRPSEPDDSAQTVRLPDDAGRRLKRAEGVLWYRFRMRAAQSEQLHALYIPHAHDNLIVYLNGEWLGQGGPFASPAAQLWYRPLYYEFDAKRLYRSHNVLDVGLQLNGSIFNRLDPPRVGEARALRPVYERAFAARIPIAQASTIVCATLFVIFAYIGLALSDSSYLALSVASGCYVISSLNYHLLQPPVSHWTFNTVTNLCLQWSGFALSHMGFVWGGVRRQLINRITGGLILAAGTVALTVPPQDYEYAMMFGFAAVALYSAGSFLAIWRARRATPAAEWATYCITGALLVPIGVRDIWLLNARVGATHGPEHIYWVPYFGPIMMLAAGASLLMRFLRVYRQAQQANVEFQRQLLEKTVELEQHFARTRGMEQHHAILKERERFMREIHDGVGGHLVAAVTLLEQQDASPSDVSDAVRDALEDLRLVVDALDPQLGDLSMLLADFRRRLEPRLRAQGLTLRWDMLAALDLPQLTPFEGLQVLRILQEAVTNVVKHASANTITFRCGTAPARQPFVEIEDDGRGIVDSARGGRGLAYMRQRAQRIGASLQVRPGQACGTSVLLQLGTEGSP